jgi:hypothetical protein
MYNAAKVALLLLSLVAALYGFRQGAIAGAIPSDAPQYTSTGQLRFPAGYREWVFLSSGMDMSYAKGAPSGDMHMFENVFVNDTAYRAFRLTGTWPDKTILVTEFRNAQGKGSINQSGRFQTGMMGIEIHVKDAKRFRGEWGFFGFDTPGKSAALIPAAASCYSCHSAHGAVNNTFVQFYPTLLPIAKAKGTLSHAYLSDNQTSR